MSSDAPVAGPTQTANPPEPQACADFSGLWIPLVTPFKDDGIDFESLKRLVAHYAQTGIEGFVVCGSTGEAAALDEAEQLAVLDAVTEQSTGKRVIMGLSGYHLGKTRARVESLRGKPLSGILLPAPSYIKPSQEGVIEWFSALADASPVPVLVYDIPGRTGCTIDLETLLVLGAHPNICAVKDCSGDAQKTRLVIASGALQVLAGDDADMFDTLARGGAGAIAASAHVLTARFAELVSLMTSGKLIEARAVWEPLLPLVTAVFAEPNPGPIKALLARQGWLRNELRSPMTCVSDELENHLAQLAESISALP